MANDIDLLITDSDLTLSGINEPRLTRGSDCIAQDIKHMIREHGYAVQMVGNRNSLQIAQLAQRIEIEVEEDTRIVPGTASVTQLSTGQFLVTATTRDYGNLSLQVAA